jgi:hypothetical protein
MGSSMRTKPVVVAVMMLAVVAVAGCGSRRPPQNVLDAENHFRNAGKVYMKYFQQNRKGPASEKELADFLAKLSDKELQDMGIQPSERDKVLVSPRDGQPYGVVPNVDMTMMMGGQMKMKKPDAPSRPPIGMYEKVGSGGKRYVWYVTGGGLQLLDEQAFKEALPEVN